MINRFEEIEKSLKTIAAYCEYMLEKEKQANAHANEERENFRKAMVRIQALSGLNRCMF